MIVVELTKTRRVDTKFLPCRLFSTMIPFLDQIYTVDCSSPAHFPTTIKMLITSMSVCCNGNIKRESGYENEMEI